MTPVAIAIVRHLDCYLVGERVVGPLAGFHEFPGGKCLPGESPEECVRRECLEETGLTVRPIRLRRRVEHTYPYGTVALHFFDCELVDGCDPSGVEHGFRWVPSERLVECRFPAPNEQLIAELRFFRDGGRGSNSA